jgi:hypothetical protein
MGHLFSISKATFRLFLWRYPAEFRQRFGPEMADVFAQQLENQSRKLGLAGVLQVSLRAASEVFTAAIPQHLQKPSALSLIGSFALCAAFLRAVSR